MLHIWIYIGIELNYQAAKKPTHELAAESSKNSISISRRPRSIEVPNTLTPQLVVSIESQVHKGSKFEMTM